MSRMFHLLKKVDGALDPMAERLEIYLHRYGLEAIEDINPEVLRPNEYCEIIVTVQEQYSHLVKHEFDSHPLFMQSIDKAFRRFINDNSITKHYRSSAKSPELLAKYCDILLRKGSVKLLEDETLEVLDSIMSIFLYIEDKDVFLVFYSRMLAKRLIHDTSKSEILEGQMISKLKQLAGFEYTTKLTRMFIDMATSRELLSEFNDSNYSKDVTISFKFLILAHGSWPLNIPETNFQVPDELIDNLVAFENFHSKKYDRRRVTWLFQFSKGELRSLYTENEIIFSCSTFQMGILLLFNEYDKISAEDIQEITNMNDITLKNTLLSLIKTRVLLVSPKNSRTITKKHRFAINPRFSSKRRKVLINVAVKDMQQVANPSIQSRIEEDRKLLIQASIVRIMKANNSLNHNELLTNVVTQVQKRFKPKINVIKKCIDILIEKGYMQRSENNKETYIYVA
eukprot:TRINITY_DN9413_c0_g1_i1.p1 TRINITY_DN9413_c0_g1~~TRINITY_DN9413_c0_g1_i1.p1  ORF type:complete len:534 (+),score=92.15 TRINITY_DN9413_c0_g1_i1:241-1602(+)